MIAFLLILAAATATFVTMYSMDRNRVEVETIYFTIGFGLLVSIGLGGFCEAVRTSGLTFVEILNGETTDKYSERVSCSHSYSCHCRKVCSGTGNNTTCSNVCDTCYEHSYDVDWVVDSTVGRFRIARVDRRGTTEPARWTAEAVGDPVARLHTYVNYVRGTDNLYKDKQVKISYKDLPAYPDRIVDYQYLDRILTYGYKLIDEAAWEKDLALSLRQLGPKKQANVIIVITGEPQGFADQLLTSWDGGNKNDVIVVIGAIGETISWVKSYSMSYDDMVNVKIRDDLLDLGKIDHGAVIEKISEDVEKYYSRRHMKDFAYLEAQLQTPIWLIVICMVLAAVTTGTVYKKFSEL